MAARVIALRPGNGDLPTVARAALDRFEDLLTRGSLAPPTVVAYRRQARAYVAWLLEHAADHPDAFRDSIGAAGAVTGWKRHLLGLRRKPATIGQALAAVTLYYQEGAQTTIRVKGLRNDLPAKSDALTRKEQDAVEREALRSRPVDAAVIALLLYCGPRVSELARLELRDLAITARTGWLRLHGKGDQVREVPVPPVARERLRPYLAERGTEPGPLLIGKDGPLTIHGLTKIVLRIGAAAGVDNLRPHRMRRTFGTEQRRAKVDVEQIRELLGHRNLNTTQRYLRADRAELAATSDRVYADRL